MPDIRIRAATADDLETINAIYNYYVPRSTCTYQIEEETAADRRTWFEHHGPEHPVIVVDMAGEVVGWGALSPFRPRAAYRRTVEDSVYVRRDLHRRGIGGRLLVELIARAGRIGHHAIVAGIDGEQTGSIALHAKHGFVEVGRMQEIGFKFDRWLDVVFLERLLT